MKILVIGTGYVGTTTGLVFAELGHQVTGLDTDEKKVEMLSKGKAYFHEPGIDEMLNKHVATGQICFTTDKKKAIRENDLIFICVGTPSREDGSADLTYVRQVARDIGENLNRYKIVVNKSTVPVKTSEQVKKWILKSSRNAGETVEVVSNPEFLREGSALEDGLHPDRIVIGSESATAIAVLKELYKEMDCPMIITTPRTAELIKYASNSFLAMKISYMNEIARLCDELQINIKDVARGMGLDPRVGEHFLQAGIGFGGSCFPKDVKALMASAREHGLNLSILEKVIAINDSQPQYLVDRMVNELGSLDQKVIAVLGIAFKPHTDDLRESRAFPVIERLLKEKALVRVHDPVASMPEDKLHQGVRQYKHAEEAARDADAVVICTDWPQYRDLDWRLIKQRMKSPFLFDGRNMLSPGLMKEMGFTYRGIGYG
ncbi:MAG: UDP-glucose/GDP-mannose dehydrogenase family protein [Bacillaceae bacterium]|nr:UDP-glucose/GDP-mannose dehydrogenase family protein [Bacillaceae bacterium]